MCRHDSERSCVRSRSEDSVVERRYFSLCSCVRYRVQMSRHDSERSCVRSRSEDSVVERRYLSLCSCVRHRVQMCRHDSERSCDRSRSEDSVVERRYFLLRSCDRTKGSVALKHRDTSASFLFGFSAVVMSTVHQKLFRLVRAVAG